MCKVCDYKCMYYPQTYSELLEEKTNEYGVKERKAVYLCGYDEHVISDFRECNNYKKLKVAPIYE